MPAKLSPVTKLALTMLVLMFLLSGVNKLMRTRTCHDARVMEKVFGKRCTFNFVILLLAGLWEVVAAGVVLYATFVDESAYKLRRQALVSLAVFTVLATAMFKTMPFKYFGFMSNVSVTGGLLLASAV